MFKKRIRNAGVRRKASSSEESEEDKNVVVRKPRVHKPIVNTSSSNKGKRHGTSAQYDSDSEDEPLETPLVTFSYKSSRSALSTQPDDMGATAICEHDTEHDKDARAILTKSLAEEGASVIDGEQVYKGANYYNKYIKPTDSVAGSAESRKGPMRAPNFIRATTRWDYAPDICKDYKETGFCTFGDSCKFLHDRGDYKFGWQLEREYETGTAPEEENYEIPQDVIEQQQIPFKCVICRDSYKSPIVTTCGHYFCEQCALKHYRTTIRCFACEANTSGIFKPAKDLQKKLASLGMT